MHRKENVLQGNRVHRVRHDRALAVHDPDNSQSAQPRQSLAQRETAHLQLDLQGLLARQGLARLEFAGLYPRGE